MNKGRIAAIIGMVTLGAVLVYACQSVKPKPALISTVTPTGDILVEDVANSYRMGETITFAIRNYSEKTKRTQTIQNNIL